MASNRPQDIINLAELGILVAKNWLQRYPTYTIKFAVIADLDTKANAFKAKALDNTVKDSDKKNNTLALKTVNKEIINGIKILKKYIKAEYPLEKDLSGYYAAYGLELIGKGGYNLIADNDRRSQRIDILLAEMSKPNNVLANKAYGLVFWQDLKNRHTTEWALSKALKGDKTSLSRETQTLMKEVDEILKKLHASIKIDFPKTDVKKILREFGFLNEVYK